MQKVLPQRPKHLQIKSRLVFQEAKDIVINMRNKPWEEVLPFIIAMIKDGDSDAQAQGMKELERMAFAADYFNEEILTNNN